MIFLHPYAEDPHYAARQAPLQRLLKRWRERMWCEQIAVYHQPDGPDLRYENAIRRFWGQDDLLICEGDIEPRYAMIQHMRSCPYPVCAQWYRITAISPTPHRHADFSEVRYPDIWADWAGLGLTRFRRDWMHQHPPAWPVGTWDGQYVPGLPYDRRCPRGIDWRITGWIRQHGARIHIHYPAVRHHHPLSEAPRLVAPEGRSV